MHVFSLRQGLAHGGQCRDGYVQARRERSLGQSCAASGDVHLRQCVSWVFTCPNCGLSIEAREGRHHTSRSQNASLAELANTVQCCKRQGWRCLCRHKDPNARESRQSALFLLRHNSNDWLEMWRLRNGQYRLGSGGQHVEVVHSIAQVRRQEKRKWSWQTEKSETRISRMFGILDPTNVQNVRAQALTKCATTTSPGFVVFAGWFEDLRAGKRSISQDSTNCGWSLWTWSMNQDPRS